MVERLDPAWFHRESKTKLLQWGIPEELRITLRIRLERQRIIKEIEEAYPDHLPKKWGIFKELDTVVGLYQWKRNLIRKYGER